MTVLNKRLYASLCKLYYCMSLIRNWLLYYAIDFLLVLMINHCARLKVYLLYLIVQKVQLFIRECYWMLIHMQWPYLALRLENKDVLWIAARCHQKGQGALNVHYLITRGDLDYDLILRQPHVRIKIICIYIYDESLILYPHKSFSFKTLCV